MEFCAKSWNFTNFPSEFYQMCALFADIRKFSIDLEKSAFSDLFCQMSRMKTLSRETHGKLRNGHGKFMEKIFA